MLNIRADLYRIALPFAEDKTRPHIYGVHVEAHPRGGALVVATDGKVMVVMHDPAGACDKPTFLRVNKNLALAGKPDKLYIKRLVVTDDGVASVFLDGMKAAMFSDMVGGFQYPDWRRIVPARPEKSVPASFSVSVTSRLVSMANEVCGGKRGHGAFCIVANDKGPALVTFMGCDWAIAVAMPYRDDNGGAMPAFME